MFSLVALRMKGRLLKVFSGRLSPYFGDTQSGVTGCHASRPQELYEAPLRTSRPIMKLYGFLDGKEVFGLVLEPCDGCFFVKRG